MEFLKRKKHQSFWAESSPTVAWAEHFWGGGQVSSQINFRGSAEGTTIL